MIEGKLKIAATAYRRMTRIVLCAVCIFLAAFVPGFVHVISFVGCFCVSCLSFVLPPLFRLKLRNEVYPKYPIDATLLVVGIATTAITSTMTFHDLFIS